MKTVKKDLTTIADQLNILAKKIEKMASMFEAAPKSSKTVKSKVRAVKKKGAPKRKNRTPTDQVLSLMTLFKKGISVEALRGKSGFTEKQISNIVHRACKNGRMKRVERGIYSVYGL